MLRYVIVILIVLLAACSSFAPPPVPTLSPLEIQGRSVFESYCSRCHSASGETVVVGPSLAGIATRGMNRIDDMDSETYIRSSILDPSKYAVDGFPADVMPASLKDELSKGDFEAVVAYLLTLK